MTSSMEDVTQCLTVAFAGVETVHLSSVAADLGHRFVGLVQQHPEWLEVSTGPGASSPGS